MRNNYSSLKWCNSYFIVSVLISKINIFSNKQNFHMHISIMKIKNHKLITILSFKFKKKKKKYIYIYILGNIVI